jgi:hypothetical protein
VDSLREEIKAMDAVVQVLVDRREAAKEDLKQKEKALKNMEQKFNGTLLRTALRCCAVLSRV